MQREIVRDLSGLDTRAHANSGEPRESVSDDDDPGPGRGQIFLCLPLMAAPAYAGSWSSLPVPLTDWVYVVFQVLSYPPP